MAGRHALRTSVLVLALALGGCSIQVAKNLAGIGLIQSWGSLIINGTDSIRARSPSQILGGQTDAVAHLRIGVQVNPARAAWDSPTGDERFDDYRVDENVLFAEFLEETGLFASVVQVAGPAANVDYVISGSVECVYSKRFDYWSYLYNHFPLLGIGFLLGVPYGDSEAFYVGEAIFYEVRDGDAAPVGGSMATNRKEWVLSFFEEHPAYYSARSLAPLFEQWLADFLLRSGCLREAPSADPVAVVLADERPPAGAARSDDPASDRDEGE